VDIKIAAPLGVRFLSDVSVEPSNFIFFFPENVGGGGNFLRNVADYTLNDLIFDKKRLSIIDKLLQTA